MNQNPTDWNEAAQWLAAGELEVRSTMPPHERWCFLHPQGLLSVSAGLQSYRRKPPEPRVPREIWVNMFPTGGVCGYCHPAYNSEQHAEMATEGLTALKEIGVHFREVLELPPLTDEELSKITDAWKQHCEIGLNACTRFIYSELRKLGRAL